MNLSALTELGFYLNGAAGSGKYENISVSDVKLQLESGNLFGFLADRLGHDFDRSIARPEERRELLDEWADMAIAIPEGKKFCVDRGGLCLLVAYILESIQRRFSEHRFMSR